MARGSKPADPSFEGMAWLALMPFPAMNPLNWWALATPRNAMLATVTNTRIALDAWRAGADGMRAMLRQQQDEALRLLDSPLEASETAARAETTASADDAAADEAPLLMRPMVEATRAYGRVGRAFIVAQRDTLRAWTGGEKPH